MTKIEAFIDFNRFHSLVNEYKIKWLPRDPTKLTLAKIEQQWDHSTDVSWIGYSKTINIAAEYRSLNRPDDADYFHVVIEFTNADDAVLCKLKL